MLFFALQGLNSYDLVTFNMQQNELKRFVSTLRVDNMYSLQKVLNK
jgi:hypothetical protein